MIERSVKYGEHHSSILRNLCNITNVTFIAKILIALVTYVTYLVFSELFNSSKNEPHFKTINSDLRSR